MRIHKKKLIGILSIGRTDYSYFKPILQEIRKSRSLEYFLIVAGMHLSREFGLTYREILEDGFRIDTKINATVASNTPQGAAKTTGSMTLGMIPVLSRNILDALLVLGDRYETLGAAAAALPYNIPVAHICGGDISEGAFDERTRHAITKLSHIHFASNQLSARRVIQMGEEPWRVFNTGLSSIDTIKQTQLYSKQEFFKLYGLNLSKKLFLVTFHPATLEGADTEYHIRNLIKALQYFDANIIITYPNADPGSRTIIGLFKKFAEKDKRIRLVKKLGIKGYYSAMKYSDVLIGNSSSGIMESATFELPVVDIGNRQKNRLTGRNVLHSDYTSRDITAKIKRSLSAAFKKGLAGIKNPYGYGNASKKIVNVLTRLLLKKPNKEIITKKFYSNIRQI